MCLIQVCSRNHLFLDTLPLSVEGLICLCCGSLCIFIVWLKLIARTWLFIYLCCCKLGHSSHKKNHLFCTCIAFCRQTNSVLTGKKLNPNLTSASEFLEIWLLCDLSGFFLFFPYNVCMRKYVLSSKWGILSLPIPPASTCSPYTRLKAKQ